MAEWDGGHDWVGVDGWLVLLCCRGFDTARADLRDEMGVSLGAYSNEKSR